MKLVSNGLIALIMVLSAILTTGYNVEIIVILFNKEIYSIKLCCFSFFFIFVFFKIYFINITLFKFLFYKVYWAETFNNVWIFSNYYIYIILKSNKINKR